MCDELFFGRNAQIAWLNDQIFTTKPIKGHSCSLRGPNGIGKTYLKNHLVDNYLKRLQESGSHSIFIIDITMKNVSYHQFLLSVFQEAADQLNRQILNESPNYDEDTVEKILSWIDKLESISTIGDAEVAFINGLSDRFFRYTSRLGLYFILIIDEFDNAREAFPEETDSGIIFNKLFDYSGKIGKFKLLSIILISRRRAGTISHHMSSGSNFDDAYPAQETTLRGFNNQEMEQYFNSYAELDCGLLPDSLKKQMLFYCGRHPDLLMKVREHIRVHCKTVDSINIASYYIDNGSGIRNAYSRMLHLLCIELVDRINKLPAISAFNQAFNISPAYDTNLNSQIALLHDFGFIIQSDKPADVPPEDISPDSIRSKEIVSFRYEPIAEGFLYYVKTNHPSMEKNEVNSLIDNTESKFRLFLQKHLIRIYGEDWQSHIDLSSFNKEDYWENLNRDAEKYGAFDRKITLSVLDVLAFFNLGLIVKQNWEALKDYLPSFKSKNELYNSCFSLTKYRNCCFHGTLKILGYEQIKELKDICNKLINDFQRDEISISTTSEGVQGIDSDHSLSSLPESLTKAEVEERQSRINTECIFLCKAKKPRGNLVGELDSGFPASISPSMASGITDPDPVGKSFRVRIVQWDNGPTAQKYNVVPV